MTGMLDVTDIGARSWLHHAAPLILGLAQDHAAENGSRTAIFAHPLDRDAQFSALTVGREWDAAAGSAALRPLFSQAARAEGAATLDGGAGRVLATQNLAPRFSATVAPDRRLYALPKANRHGASCVASITNLLW